MLNNSIQIFNNPDFGAIRTVIIDNEPWFVGKDVAVALNYNEPHKAIQRHIEQDDRTKHPVTDLTGRSQEVWIINESGLYSLIFGSKLESAKKFKKWVTSEVLPSIRKTGSYNAPPRTIPEQIQLLAQGTVELTERVNNIQSGLTDMQEELQNMKMDLPILPIEADRITTAVRQKGTALLGGKHSAAYRNTSLRQKVYISIYSNIKYNFNVSSYKQLKRSECDKVVGIVNSYKLPVYLQDAVESENEQQCFVF